MKQKLLILTGVLALAPTLAVADYCRDCRDDAHTHTYQHDHRHYDGHDQKAWKKTWKKAQRKHAREHRRVVVHNGNDLSSTAYARVVDVEPVYRYYTQTVQDTSCLQRNRQYTGHTNWAPAVLGAVIGGAVGHRVGDAHGDPDAAAIAGDVHWLWGADGVQRAVEPPSSYYRMHAETLPESFTSLAQDLPHRVQAWAVILPAEVIVRIEEIVSSQEGGALVIDGQGEVTLERQLPDDNNKIP
ncbi:MAG: hypothetical protein ACPG1A_00590 [Halioglobus sp.]